MTKLGKKKEPANLPATYPTPAEKAQQRIKAQEDLLNKMVYPSEPIPEPYQYPRYNSSYTSTPQSFGVTLDEMYKYIEELYKWPRSRIYEPWTITGGYSHVPWANYTDPSLKVQMWLPSEPPVDPKQQKMEDLIREFSDAQDDEDTACILWECADRLAEYLHKNL